MSRIHLHIIAALLFTVSTIKAQIAPNYEIATWYHFKNAAISYTFDDFTQKQYSAALPIFDLYGYKTTFFIITDKQLDWSKVQTAAANGHEIACHTTQHISLDKQSLTEQDATLSNAQAAINTNIPIQKCQTIAYPYCKPGDFNIISKYFIAGRICSNTFESTTPTDFYQISAIPTGSASDISTAAQLNNTVEKAKLQNAWCVFLLHGIDDDGGYSPLLSGELAAHVSFINLHPSDYWPANFITVVKYIKERDAATLSESVISNDSILVNLNDGLDNNIFNTAITIRRNMPEGWSKAKVYQSGKLLKSSLVSINSKQYIEFDAIPDAGLISISSGATLPIYSKISLKKGWNNIICPINGTTPIASALSSVWSNIEIVKSENLLFNKQIGTSLNQLSSLDGGQRYVIKVSADCELDWIIR